MPVAAEEGEQLLSGRNTCFSSKLKNNIGGCKNTHCLFKMYDGLCGAHSCVQSSIIIEQQHSILFCCGMNSEEGEHSGLLVLEYGSQSSVFPHS